VAAFDHHFDAVLTARWSDQVDRLGCLRRISALTGLALTVEIGDWTRFTRVLDWRLCRVGAVRILLGRHLQGIVSRARVLG
jgi:hypothetical protein